jgi:L-iditol 2-dehydrogenase
MKAAVLTGLRRIALRERPEPRLERDTDVLLRTGIVGLCGSDVHYYETGRIGSQVVRYPFLVGHECSATVEAVGAAVTRVKPGDRVAVDPAMPCGACDQCRCGRPHTCRHLGFLGTPGQAEGCLCELLAMPETSCFPVGDRLSLEQAALVEPLSIGVYAAAFLASMQGARIAILGSGPIGLSVLLAARAAGAAAVYMTDLLDERLAAARRAGADWAGHARRDRPVETIAAREPLLLDAVFECCGQPSAMDQAVDLLQPGGQLVLVGIPREDRVSFAIDSLRHKELRIQNVRRQNACVQRAVDLLAGGCIDADFMITHRYALDRAADGFELVAQYRDGVIKAVIDMRL